VVAAATVLMVAGLEDEPPLDDDEPLEEDAWLVAEPEPAAGMLIGELLASSGRGHRRIGRLTEEGGDGLLGLGSSTIWVLPAAELAVKVGTVAVWRFDPEKPRYLTASESS